MRIFTLLCLASYPFFFCAVCFEATVCITFAQDKVSVDAVILAESDPEILKWEKDILAFEELDKLDQDPKDAILFVGSSSIRLWDAIKSDMETWPVIQRGFGGSKFSDIAYYATRLIKPHEYRALVLFAGNDISGTDRDHSPEQIVGYLNRIIEVAKTARPSAPIFVIAITPTPSRFHVWEKTRGANNAIKKLCEANDDVYFIETESSYLLANGEPDKSIFKEDLLHQNATGYQRWSGLIKRQLEIVLERNSK